MCLSEIESGFKLVDRVKQWGKRIKEKFSKNQEEKNNPVGENFPFYFENYTKHVTIYKNGNGIIINSANLVVTDKQKFNKIYRMLNIEDGKVDSNFPQLEHMVKVCKDERFNKFGFWYYAEDKIISEAKEYYWSDTDKFKEDKKIKGNPKEIRWYFNFNKGIIEENKPYSVIYVVSVKGLYPIKDGMLDLSAINDPNSENENSSSIEIEQNIKNLTYIVSFEDGIELEVEPVCEVYNVVKSGINEVVSDEFEYNILYNKHKFKVTNPVLGSKIKVFWKFKSN